MDRDRVKDTGKSKPIITPGAKGGGGNASDIRETGKIRPIISPGRKGGRGMAGRMPKSPVKTSGS